MNGLPAARVNIRGETRDVRADHVARYRWAAERSLGTPDCGDFCETCGDCLKCYAEDRCQKSKNGQHSKATGHVIDAGCNCGYGAAILADAGLIVAAFDDWFQGLEYARRHWARPGITWVKADFEGVFEFPTTGAVVAFELIEHLDDPRPLLTEARRVAGRLFASVPNQAVWPWTPRMAPVHKQHYTRRQLEALLTECGWSVVDWWGQAGGNSPVEREVHGRTLVVECR